MSDTADRPVGLTEEDLKFARLAIRVHCAIAWPEGARCLNCAKPHPCEIYEWGESVLYRIGWTAEQIDALDTRTGAWS